MFFCTFLTCFWHKKSQFLDRFRGSNLGDFCTILKRGMNSTKWYQNRRNSTPRTHLKRTFFRAKNWLFQRCFLYLVRKADFGPFWDPLRSGFRGSNWDDRISILQRLKNATKCLFDRPNSTPGTHLKRPQKNGFFWLFYKKYFFQKFWNFQNSKI